jgi:hypothetical protein
MRASLTEGRRGSLLSSGYWWRRLNKLLDAARLTRAQLDAPDRLLLQLDAFDARHPSGDVTNQSFVSMDISTTRVRRPKTS